MKWGKKKQMPFVQPETIEDARTQNDLEMKLAALGELAVPERNRVTCALIGHSRIVTMCLGYVSCARCGDQIGDTIGGTTDLGENVVAGHNCDTCRENYTKLTWADKLFVADPFEGQKE